MPDPIAEGCRAAAADQYTLVPAAYVVRLLDELEQTRTEQSAVHVQLMDARDRVTELETFMPGIGAGEPMPLSAFANWLHTADRGLSSHAIIGALTGRRTLPGRPVVVGIEWPLDAGDFWRCEQLLRAVPEAREHMLLIAELSPEWSALVAHWDDLAILDRPTLTDRIWELIETPRRNRRA
ncbi:hypothetical protein [Nocardia sp. NBC_01388]|uniref:hypothetical protein n=1 Tax=Nocardia sp. NBC_01388 TaxID=2903596 RepID=UPI0032569903